jgi:hypothetical protein
VRQARSGEIQAVREPLKEPPAELQAVIKGE